MVKLKYRAEIDALRAIAVSAVIIYHAKIFLFNELFLPGGFLGVDIFFVISGYLISSLIFRELDETKNFSFKNFYERRARRILPALFFVILVSIPFGWLYIQPTGFIDFAKSVLFSIGFTSNLYFYSVGQVYGAESGLLKPLLHTWSLSIEEQYYIIFPLLFFILYKFFKKKVFAIVFLVAFVSLVFSSFFSNINPSLNFYVLFSRIWELLAGTIIFFLEKLNKKKNNRLINNSLVGIGLLIIFSSFFLFQNEIGYPNLETLYPILGVMLVIYYSGPDVLMTRLLSNKLLVSIGLISYSLYLWHYPIFAFARLGHLTHSYNDYFFTGLLIFICSTLSYFFIEKPFRVKKIINFKYFLISIFGTLSILIVISLNIISNKGYDKRFPLEGTFQLDNMKYKEDVRLLKYELGSPNFTSLEKKKILVFGNSHGRDFFNMFALNKDLFPDYEFSMMDGQVRCLKTLIDEKSLCKRKVPKKLLDNFLKSDFIIISTAYNKEDLNEIESAVKMLKQSQKKVIITSMMPKFYFKNSRSLIDEFFYINKRLPNINEKETLEKKKFDLSINETDQINLILRNISKRNNVKFLDKKDYLCINTSKKCFVLTDKNKKIETDESHLTVSGAKFFGEVISKINWLEID